MIYELLLGLLLVGATAISLHRLRRGFLGTKPPKPQGSSHSQTHR